MDSSPPGRSTERRSRLVGIGLMCGALLCFSCLDATAKWLNRAFDPLLTVWWRYAGEHRARDAVHQSGDAPGV